MNKIIFAFTPIKYGGVAKDLATVIRVLNF
jgi:hypothetical protein